MPARSIGAASVFDRIATAHHDTAWYIADGGGERSRAADYRPVG